MVAPRLPLVWVAKLSAALVLLEVSAARVEVALKAVPAEAAAAALHDVAERLELTGATNATWQTEPAELRLQANWLRGVAANVLECAS